MALQQSVGLRNDGSFEPNLAVDQQHVADLLMSIPLPNGGLRTASGPAVEIPQPFLDGAASGELIGAIQGFQTVQSANLNIDLRVEPNGPTLLALESLAAAQGLMPPTIPVSTVVLDASALVVEERPPAPVSGLPSIVYTPATAEQLVFDNGAVRVTMALSGVLTGSWGPSFGLACLVSPQLSALDQAVKSGDARRIDATALDQACGELRAQTRMAANGLFSSVAISANQAGTFSVSGSLGDQWRQVSMGFVFPNTVTATGSITVSKEVAVASAGGTVKFSGTMACTITVMFRDNLPPDEPSLLAHLAVVLIAGRVVLVPLAPWIARAATIEGARAIVRASAAGLVAERVMLGPSPSL